MNELIVDIEKKFKEIIKQIPFLDSLINKQNTQVNSDEEKTQAGQSEDAGDKTSVSRVNVLEAMNAKEGKKPFKLQRVHIIAIGLIAFLLLDDDLMNTEAPAPVDPVQVQKQEEKSLEKIKSAIEQIPEVKTPPPEKKVVETPVVPETQPEVIAEVPPPVVEAQPVEVEQVTVQPVVDEAPLAEPTPVVSEAVVEAPVETYNESPVVSETISTEEMLPSNEVIPSESEPVPEVVAEDSTMGEATANVSDVTAPQNVTEDVLEDLEQQFSQKKQSRSEKLFYSIPRYDFVGRGLVYSCRGKHWACVNAENYGKCEKNYNFLKNVERPKECYPTTVFATNEDCFTAQQEKIDGVEKSEFCK